MSEEQSEYRELLEDVARVIDVPTHRTESRGQPYFHERREVPIPDRRLRDDIMRRLGVMQDAHGRMEDEYRMASTGDGRPFRVDLDMGGQG